MRRLIIGCLIFFIPNICLSKISPKDGGDKVVIKKGDTLWSLARKYYSDPRLWPKFLEYNLIDNPDRIYPGERIAIGRDLALELAQAMRGRIRALERERGNLRKKIDELKKEKKALILEYEEKIAELKKGLPSDPELRLKHQAEIEFMEHEILSLQKEIVERDKEKAALEVKLSGKIQEIIEKKKEIERREEEIKLLEEKLAVSNDEVKMLRIGILELEERLAKLEKELEDRDIKIEKLKGEKALYIDFAHFLIFVIASGLVALGVIN